MQTIGGTFLALVMLVGTTQIFVSAQNDRSGNSDASLTADSARKSLEGVWQTTITVRICGSGNPIRTFRGLTTYHAGGTVSETSTALSPALRSPGYGVWDKENSSDYSSSFIFLRFNPDGTFAGTQKTTSVIELDSADGDSYSTTTSIQVFDANDVQIGTGCATATATRYE